MARNNQSDKGRRTAYWIITSLLVLAMIGGGLAQFFQMKVNAEGFMRLGYPLYSLKIIGAWKIAGGIVLLVPGYLLAKEWAYAGFFVLLTSAVLSHIASGDAFYQWVAPLIFAVMTVLSWYLRPADRRISITTASQSVQHAY